MLGRFGAVCGALVLLAPSAASAQAVPVQAYPAQTLVIQRPQEVVSGSALPSNSEIWLSMNSVLSSKSAKVGSKFDMAVPARCR